MAWFGNVSLGNFPDLAGAVTKLSESVKNIEKNFDSALGLEDKPGGSEGLWPSPPDSRTLFKPVMAFMGHKADDSAAETSGKDESLKDPSITEGHNRIFVTDSPIPEAKESSVSAAEVIVTTENESEESKFKEGDSSDFVSEEVISNAPGEFDEGKSQTESNSSQVDAYSPIIGIVNAEDSSPSSQREGGETINSDESQSNNSNLTGPHVGEQVESSVLSLPDESHHVSNSEISHYKQDRESEHFHDNVSHVQRDVPDGEGANLVTEPSVVTSYDTIQCEGAPEVSDVHLPNSISDGQEPFREADSAKLDNIGPSSKSLEMCVPKMNLEVDGNQQSRTISVSNSADPMIELEKLTKEMKLMEAALQGAARQAQSKADEIARLMNENEQLKSNVEDLKRKSTEAEVAALHEEYHQRVAALERKVYTLTRERDTLRREQNKKSDAAALLKEKDEIISQVMAEGEELSKKQAAQEATIRKLRAQIREFEEEKQRLNSKLQVEEAKFESIKRDKVATEKLLQETIEKNQAELAAQKEFYTNALNAAKEAEALAEARANNEARTELESRLREASERESVLVQTLEELRQGLSRTEQQAVFREDMLRRDIDDLQKRYQASELRYNELVSEVPESTRPLLRQIEAMQETTARRAEAWAGVERALNSRLQEAEAKAAAAEEKERAMNDRLSQSLSRITVLETQIACLRTEQTQLSRSLEKERQRASENRQEYLAAMEEAATQEGRAKQLEDEIKELRSKHKRVLQEELTKTELLEKELEREKSARMELEKTASCQISRTTSQDRISKLSSSTLGNGNMQIRKLSSAGSLGSMEESQFLQASLDSSGSSFSERRGLGESTMSPYFLKSNTPSAFEAALRQKDGELASYVSRLVGHLLHESNKGFVILHQHKSFQPSCDSTYKNFNSLIFLQIWFVVDARSPLSQDKVYPRLFVIW